MYLQLHVLPVVMYLHKAAPFVSKPCLCFNVVVPGGHQIVECVSIVLLFRRRFYSVSDEAVKNKKALLSVF